MTIIHCLNWTFQQVFGESNNSPWSSIRFLCEYYRRPSKIHKNWNSTQSLSLQCSYRAPPLPKISLLLGTSSDQYLFQHFRNKRPGGGGYSLEFLVGVCRPHLQIQTQFQTKKCHFPHPFSDLTSKIHTRFQTWPCTWLSIAYASVLNGSQRNKDE